MTATPELSTIRTTDYHLTADSGFMEVLLALGWADAAGFDASLAAAASLAGGRGPQRRIDLPGSSLGLRLREARRGGVLANLLADRFLSPARVERELALWLRLRDRGAPLPAPVAAVARRRGPLWQTHFAALEHPHAVDGLAWLASAPSPEALRRGIEAVARGLRRFHDAGAVHGDLNLRNVLIEPGGSSGPECLFIDLDHARSLASVPTSLRLEDGMRLLRSLEKRGFAPLVDARLRARALAAYCADDRRLRHALVAARGAERWRLQRHRIAWRVQKIFSRSVVAGLAVVALACGVSDDSSTTTETRAERTSAWSILALGDTGRATALSDPFEGQLAVAEAMTREARREPVDGLVFLGDNFYDSGIATDALVSRVRLNLVGPYCYFLALTGRRSPEVASACPLAPDERRPVPLFAVLGNHDLELPESAALERTAIAEFLPGWQMSPGLVRVVEIHPGVSLILFESEIAIDDRAAIEDGLVAAIREAKGPWRILATHRPIATDDLGGVPHGGYPDYVRDALVRAGLPVQLVLAGHHHNLQAFALGAPTPLLQIVAGSGSRSEPPLATGHPDLRFSALKLGFVRVELTGEANGEDERLAVSIFEVPRWPWLARLLGHRLAARFAVDRSGGVDSPESSREGRRPDA